MARYQSPSGGNKYKITDPIYGTLDKDEVDSNPGQYALMVRTVHAKENGRLVAHEDRRFVPNSYVDVMKSKGWREVSLSASEKAARVPSETAEPAKKGK